MDPGVVIAIISLVINAATAAIKAAPDKADKWRKDRLRKLETLAEEGFTPAQEEELRSIGLGAAATAERETRTRRADALATLAGGATANDIMAAEARDSEAAQKIRLQVENEVKRADRQERELRRQEQAQLIADKEAKSKEKRAVVTQAIGDTLTDVANVGVASMTAADETGKSAAFNAAYQQATGMVPQSQSVQAKQAASSGSLFGGDPQLQELIKTLSPEQKAQLAAMFSGSY